MFHARSRHANRNGLLQTLRWLQISLVAAIAVAGVWWASLDRPGDPVPLA